MISTQNTDPRIVEFSRGIQYYPILGIFSQGELPYSAQRLSTSRLDVLPCPREIQGFIFVLTTRCNLRCQYCYSVKQSDGRTMAPCAPVEILQQNIGNDTKVVFINFFGGEPTLEMPTIKRTVAYLQKIRGKTIYLRLTTNGLCSAADIDYLVDNNFSIVVSSDGRPKESSTLAKRRTARLSERRIVQLADRNAVFRVRCTITTENLSALPESIRYWASLGVKHVHLEPYNPVDGSQSAHSLLPHWQRFTDVFDEALDVAEEASVWVQTGAFMNLLTPSTYFCTGASGKYRVFNPDGSITTCYRVQNSNHKRQEFVVGTWEANDLKAPIFPPFDIEDRILRQHSVNSMTPCKTCSYQLLCGGGCLMRNLIHTGSIHRPDPWACRVKRQLLQRGLTRAWKAVQAGISPVVFGRAVFENQSLGQSFALSTRVIPRVLRSNTSRRHNAISDFAGPGVIDMYRILGIPRKEGLETAYRKVSRAECI